jgi:formylglycine-generating enzyme required for sulfatase activity
MKKTNLLTYTKRWLLAATLIIPTISLADSPKITVDPVVHDGQWVIFVLKNYEDRGFICTFIQATATVKDHQGNGHVIALRSIVAQEVILPAGSRETRIEVGKELIMELKNQFEQPRIVNVTVPSYECQPTIKYVTADKKVFRDYLKDGSLGPEMVWIPAGSFLMGNIQGGCESNEHPVHQVSVEKFAMGRYEITVSEFRQFVNATGYKTDAEKGGKCNTWVGNSSGKNWRHLGFTQNDNHPVVCVSWHDVTAYARWLSQQTGQHYRLPTEAEWEYAARAGTNTKYWWGNEIGANKANCRNSDCKDNFEYTAPVGSFMANPFGLHDTVGNVWEWTCSEYEDRYQGKEKRCVRNASLFALRGGSWVNDAWGARAANRYRGEPTVRDVNLGARLARQ